MISGACTREQKMGGRRSVVQWLVQKCKQTHSAGKRLGQGRTRKLSSATESNVVNKARSGKCAPSSMRGYDLNKETPPTRCRLSDTRRSSLKYMSVTQRKTLTSTQIQEKLASTCERLHSNWEVAYLPTKTLPTWSYRNERLTRP